MAPTIEVTRAAEEPRPCPACTTCRSQSGRAAAYGRGGGDFAADGFGWHPAARSAQLHRTIRWLHQRTAPASAPAPATAKQEESDRLADVCGVFGFVRATLRDRRKPRQVFCLASVLVGPKSKFSRSALYSPFEARHLSSRSLLVVDEITRPFTSFSMT